MFEEQRFRAREGERSEGGRGRAWLKDKISGETLVEQAKRTRLLPELRPRPRDGESRKHMVKGGLQAPDVEGQNPRRIRREAVTPHIQRQ